MNGALERRVRLKARSHMSTITVKDGIAISSIGRGDGPVVTLSHGWALSFDMWDGQMVGTPLTGYTVTAWTPREGGPHHWPRTDHRWAVRTHP